MVLPGAVRNALRPLMLIPGFHTRRKILVIESDDWGSIRMPSRAVYEALLKQGVRVDRFPFNRYDSLASEEDLTALAEVLMSVRDRDGRRAVMTVNTIVANPDFDRIRASDFREYHYEPFTETLRRYPRHGRSFELWREAMAAGLFRPQFHGREHLNVIRWMKALREERGRARLAFGFRMSDLSQSETITEDTFVDALNFEDPGEISFQEQSITEGTGLFSHLFGYRASSFIAPNYIWSSCLNDTLRHCGISSFQGIWLQFEPLTGREHRFRRRWHYPGEKNALGQCYLVRTAGFEPSLFPGVDCVDRALARINTCFLMGKPAVLGSHRLNFVGCIDPSNRQRNLPQFRRLLTSIVQRWPDVEFMSSDQLTALVIPG